MGCSHQAYLECMDAYLNKETEYGWYLCLDGGKIVGGMAGSFCVWFRVMANQI